MYSNKFSYSSKQAFLLVLFCLSTGESALHMAIVNANMQMVKLLVGRYRARLDQRARGRFFRPDDLKERNIGLKKSKYEGTAYLGEYPLAFCASTGNNEIYDYLVDQSLRRKPGEGRCHPNAKDSFGNTVVHMAIIHNQKVGDIVYVWTFYFESWIETDNDKDTNSSFFHVIKVFLQF